ncbi:protein kinase domain-containing protein [Sorangium sp. So ce131]|uniref:protein kinase domain-containing protein n=1 Tax=Sorangium sp. So ce131 TaxID=3133282 RepID=UPI003F5F28E0
MGNERPMLADPAMTLTHLAGQWLGPFQLIQLLGTGAMGAVYLARDSVLQRDVAVKLIAKGSGETDTERRDRFLREARAAARLLHPNVVQIFQVGEDEDVRFIAMEYVHGLTTAQAAKQHGGRLPEQFGIEKMREAAAALELAASFGITHRDIKPANLLLTASGTLKIADFGLASHPGGGSGALGSSAAARTLEGTPFYMSPEQWTGQDIAPPSDIYSLGCTFYHLLIGRTPYSARDLAGCFQAHCHAAVPDPKLSMPDIDPLLAELLRRCMAKKPQERPSAAHIVAFLEDMLMLRRSSVRPRELPEARSSLLGSVDLSERISQLSLPPRGSLPTPTGSLAAPTGSLAAPTGSLAAPTGSLPAPTGSLATPTGTILVSSSSALGGATGQYGYREHFGLTGYPFSDIRQPSFFWDAGPYAWILRTLASQIVAGQRPAILVGEPGSGRTFVCEMIKNKVPRIQVFTVEPQLLFGTRPLVALCRQVGATGVSPTLSQQFLVDAFLGQALLRAGSDAIAVLVVDGVDPEDHELVMELHDILRCAPQGRLSMILVGAPDLPSILSSNGAPRELYSGAQSLLLPGMTQQEMIEYIDFRMRSVGGSGRGLRLDVASQQLLHARSGGSPKLINIFCHNALTLAALQGEPEVGLSSIRLGMKSKSYLTAEAAASLLRG